jgi:hypothetical protein
MNNDQLRDYLAGCDRTTVTMSFGRIEEFVGPLPASARKHRPWWATRKLTSMLGERPVGTSTAVDHRSESVRIALGRAGGSHPGAH